MIVVIVSAIAGILIGLLGGYKIPKCKCFRGYKIKPLFNIIQIPALVGMIVAGCIARNFFGNIMKAYPEKWAAEARNLCLAILLLRGGMYISFKGKGLLVFLLTLVPLLIEANTVSWIAYSFFHMPLPLCYALGFSLACISPAIIIPGLMSLISKGYARKNEIAVILIASGTFDNVVGIILFGICSSLAFI